MVKTVFTEVAAAAILTACGAPDKSVTPAAASPEPGPQRRQRSRAERRRIVEESLVPGASVARVARAHAVNANQVFRWRQLYRQGLLEDEASPAWLPVQIAETAAEAAAPRRGAAPAGAVELETKRGRLRIEGADRELVRLLAERLLG